MKFSKRTVTVTVRNAGKPWLSMAVRDAARRLGTRDLSDCDLYSSAMPCPMCQGALYWAGVSRIHTDGTPDPGVVPNLGC